MVINDFNLIWTGACPYKTDPILIIDPNAMLTYTISGKLLQPVTRWNTKFIEGLY